MTTISNAIQKVKKIYFSKNGSIIVQYGDPVFNAQDDEVGVLQLFIEDGAVSNGTTLINYTPEKRTAYTSHWFFAGYRRLVEEVMPGDLAPKSFAQFDAIVPPNVLLENDGKTSLIQNVTVIQRYGSKHIGNYATLTALETAHAPTEELEISGDVSYIYGDGVRNGFYQVEDVEGNYTWVLKTSLNYSVTTKQYNLFQITVGRGYANPQGVPTVAQSTIYQLMQEINSTQVTVSDLDLAVDELIAKTNFIEQNEENISGTIYMEFGSIGESGELLEAYNKLRSADFLKTIPTRVIELSNNMSYNMYVVAYDENKTYISTSSPIVGTGNYTTPSGAYYLKIRTSTDQISPDAVFTYEFTGSVVSLIADVIYNENGEIEKLKVQKIDFGNGYKMYSALIDGETTLYEAVLEALENEFNIFTVKAPSRNPKEATITLKVNGDGITNQFVDISCMRYDNEVQGSMEIVMQKRGETTPLPYFTINFNDGLGAGRVKKFTVQPDAIPIEMVSTGIKVRRNNNYNNTGAEAEYQVINLTDLYDDVEDLKNEIILKADKTYVDAQDQALDDYFESEINNIKNGTTIVKKAEQDKNGNDIVNTYETKADATSKKTEIDGRLNTAEGEIDTLQEDVQALETANMIKSYTYNPSTHVLTFTYFDNSTTSLDLPLESAIVGASYDNVTKDITFTLQSGATLVVPLDDLISGLASETWVTTYFIPKTALKTAFSATPLDTNVISEKLAKDTFDTKANTFDIENKIQNGDFSNSLDGYTVAGSGVTSIVTDVTLSGNALQHTTINQTRVANQEIISDIDDIMYFYIPSYLKSYTAISGSTNTLFSISDGGSYNNIIFVPRKNTNINEWLYQSYYWKNTKGNIRLSLGALGNLTRQIVYDNLVTINVSKTFGYGNEPSQVQLDNLMKYKKYFSKSTVSIKDLYYLKEDKNIYEDIVVTIKKTGGDYSSLRSCFSSILPTKYKKYIIEIYEGEWNINDEYTTTEWDDVAFKGLFVPDFVTLVGIGKRENIIIKASNGSNLVSTLNLSNTCSLKNLTILGENLRYTIHDDWALSEQECLYYYRNVEGCVIKGKNLLFGSVYGAGQKQGAIWKFKDTIFENDGSNLTFSNHNNVNWLFESYIEFENCRFNVVESTSTVRFGTLRTNANNVNTQIIIKGCKMDTLYFNEENESIYGKGMLYRCLGYANVINSVVISVTDGVDYTSKVDLI